ncbi:Initiator protein NS1 like protein [Argiope bruennichi]|uniref:Initiator protein NS1 like protein n=1 Tax=Argiope bruennichi TaxID=94029 RepID=A0A8T0F4Z7_ARGBR|nr:Initiator protein NS1 like protein [Argiope bruennichi]
MVLLDLTGENSDMFRTLKSGDTKFEYREHIAATKEKFIETILNCIKNGRQTDNDGRRIGELDQHVGPGSSLEPSVVGVPASERDQPLEDQAASQLRLRAIKNLDPECYQFAKDTLFDLLGEPFRLLLATSFGATQRYVSEVLVLGREETHVHIVHGCAYSNRSCRCRWKNHPIVRECIKKSIRQAKFLRQLSWIDWVYVLLYFFVSKRGLLKKIWIDGRTRRLQSSSEDLRWSLLCKRSKILLEGKGEGVRRNSGSEIPNDEEGESTVSRNVRIPSGKRSRFEVICQSTQLLLPVNETHYLSACKLFTQTVNSYSLLELKNLLKYYTCLV